MTPESYFYIWINFYWNWIQTRIRRIKLSLSYLNNWRDFVALTEYRDCAAPYVRHYRACSRHCHTGYGMLSLWFNELLLIVHWITVRKLCIFIRDAAYFYCDSMWFWLVWPYASLNHNWIRRIQYEYASRTGLLKLCNKSSTPYSTVYIVN